MVFRRRRTIIKKGGQPPYASNSTYVSFSSTHRAGSIAARNARYQERTTPDSLLRLPNTSGIRRVVQRIYLTPLDGAIAPIQQGTSGIRRVVLGNYLTPLDGATAPIQLNTSTRLRSRGCRQRRVFRPVLSFLDLCANM